MCGRRRRSFRPRARRRCAPWRAARQRLCWWATRRSRPAAAGDRASAPISPRRYIADVRAIGAVPVLVTSLSRRNYKDGVLVEDLTPYVEATKKVGAAEYVTVIDLNGSSVSMLKRMTQAEADKFDKGAPDPNAKTEATGVDAVPASGALDRTHLNPYGQKVFGRIVADQIVRTQAELGPDVVGEPMKPPPAMSQRQ